MFSKSTTQITNYGKCFIQYIVYGYSNYAQKTSEKHQNDAKISSSTKKIHYFYKSPYICA